MELLLPYNLEKLLDDTLGNSIVEPLKKQYGSMDKAKEEGIELFCGKCDDIKDRILYGAHKDGDFVSDIVVLDMQSQTVIVKKPCEVWTSK